MKDSFKLDIAILALLVAAFAAFIAVATVAPKSLPVAIIISVLIVVVCLALLTWAFNSYTKTIAKESEVRKRGELIKTIPCLCEMDEVGFDGYVILYDKGILFADDCVIETSYNEIEGGIELIDFEYYESMQWVHFDSTAVSVKYHNGKVLWFSSGNRLRMKALYELIVSKGVEVKTIDIPEELIN